MLECVPNVSEGRRREVIRSLSGVLHASGASLLDVHSDPDHNRTVFTLVGTPKVLERALLDLFEQAVAAIRLDDHDGVHPRTGAVDVVPFVPLGGFPVTDAVALARGLAEKVAERFKVPCYLYGMASHEGRPSKLADLRRSVVSLAPDHGGATPHPTAGVSMIGVRDFLVAFNVQLESDDLDAARQIAAAVRESNGGLPGVQALGFRLETAGCVQVSMNLHDLTRTGMGRAYSEVARLASERGIAVRSCELVGLAPLNAVLDGAACGGVGMELKPWMIFETHMARLPGLDPFEVPLLDVLPGRGTPGGGSASALAGALGAATGEKVAVISGSQRAAAIRRSLLDHRQAFLRAAAEDARVLDKLLKVYGKKDAAATDRAARLAASVPLNVLERCCDCLRDLHRLLPEVRKSVVGDLAVAKHLLLACAAGAAASVDANLAFVDESDAGTLSGRSAKLLAQARIVAELIRVQNAECRMQNEGKSEEKNEEERQH